MPNPRPPAWGPDNFVAGSLCLDFANTVGGKGKERAPDYLETYGSFLGWAEAAGLLDAAAARRRERHRGTTDDTGAAALVTIRDQRDRIFRIFSAVAGGTAPPAGDLAALNGGLAACGDRLAVEPTEEGFRWGWRGLEEVPEGPLWPVLRSAAELLTSPELTLVRECGRCSWLFLDRSRNKRRRWCQMEVCGNRSKAERHYRRKRTADGSAG